jgi:putative molybdenum carrier protein
MIRILSGGQTGVDRAALDFALAHGIDYGGWCPKGGWAEDMHEPLGLRARYPSLRERPTDNPRERTEWNVRDSDATLVLLPPGVISPGTEFAIACARKYSKPVLIMEPEGRNAVARAIAWLKKQTRLAKLNIAGPRESECPGIYKSAHALLVRLLSSLTNNRDADSL